MRETVSGAKSVSWLQSRPAASFGEKRVRHGRRDFYTARGFLPRQIAPLPFDKNNFDAGCTRPPPEYGGAGQIFLKRRAAASLTLHQTIEAARCHRGSRPFWRRRRQRRVDNAVQKSSSQHNDAVHDKQLDSKAERICLGVVPTGVFPGRRV